MARTPRCLIRDVDTTEATLDRATRHHVERVLRLRPGSQLELVDGRGGLARALLVAGGRLDITERFPRATRRHPAVHLAVAPPRPSRLDWLVEKATELGVDGVHLLSTRHAAREVSAPRLERLRRKADEALLQCRRLHRMQVTAPRTLDDVLADDASAELWLADAPRDTGPRPPALPAHGSGAPILAIVGPEAGFHDDELARLREAGALPVRVGDDVLRVETAALALAVLAASHRAGPESR